MHGGGGMGKQAGDCGGALGAQSRGEQGLGLGWVAYTSQEAHLGPGRPGPAEITQTWWKGLSGVLLFSIVCDAGATQREARAPHYACVDHLWAFTQPPTKWLLL